MRSRSRTTQPHSAVCSAGVPGNATFAPTPPPAAASLPSSSRFPMAASAAAPLSRRSVFDAAYIRSEFSAAGVSAHFIPLIWKYASIRQNPRRMAQSRPFPSPLSSSPFLIFFFCLTCVHRYVLQNPWCGDLCGVPSLPATAYALLQQKFRPTTSTLTTAADSKDRTTTKLLIRLQVIWLDYATWLLAQP